MATISFITILGLCLTLNAQIIFGAPLKKCVENQTILTHSDSTCQSIAVLCRVSMTVLFENNEFFQNGDVCNGPLKPDVEICCEVENEDGRTRTANHLQRECPKECPGVVAEVCGSDGSSYLNNCFLQKEACKFPEQHLKVISIGHCGGRNAFEKGRDPHQGFGNRRNNRTRPGERGRGRPDFNFIGTPFIFPFVPPTFTQFSGNPFFPGFSNGAAITFSSVPTSVPAFDNTCRTKNQLLCVFPFNYKGKRNFGCLAADQASFWCATSRKADGEVDEWAWCDFNCPLA